LLAFLAKARLTASSFYVALKLSTVEKQLAVLAPDRKKLLWRILLLVAISYNAFANRDAIKRGWQDGWAGTYNPPVALRQK
jgi:hypothetical protein